MSFVQIIIVVSGIISGFFLIWGIAFLNKLHKQKKEDERIKNTSFLFSGNLKQTSLIETIQFLEIGNREGVLHIYCGRRKGYITFCGGKVIDAFYRNITGRDAVIEMFEIDEGDFYFEPKKIYQPRIIKDTILDLAFEWDEFQKNRMMKNPGGEAEK